MLFDFEGDFSSKEIFYFAQALETISKGSASIYFDAFKKKNINQAGVDFTKKELLFIFKQLKVKIHSAVAEEIPDCFKIYIKNSPLSNFRKWIFKISNQSYLKNKDPSLYEQDFFLKKTDQHLYFFNIICNLAHEKMLSHIYDATTIDHYFQTLSMKIPSDNRIIIYRNYLTDEIFKMDLIVSKETNLKRFLDSDIKLNIVKTQSAVKYKVSIDNFNERIYALNLKEKSLIKKSSTILTKDEFSDDFFIQSRKKVMELIEKHNGEVMETNKFGNISLGRVSKTPILINLSKKNANIKIALQFDREAEILNILYEEEIIKTFTIMKYLKSNWLEKAKTQK